MLEAGKHNGEATDEVLGDSEDLHQVKARSDEIYGLLCQCCSVEA